MVQLFTVRGTSPLQRALGQVALLAGILLLFIPAWAVAGTGSDRVLGAGDVERGSLLLRVRDSSETYLAPTVDTRVDMDVSGMLARVTVEQRFSNPGQDWVNGTYVFPLPERAAVDHLWMQVGERIIEGQIKAREEARKIYRKAEQAGRKASLVEQQRPNLFTSRVANIGPGEAVTVRIQYQQTLAYTQGRFSIRFPMTVGIRYIPGAQAIGGFDGGGWAFNTRRVPDASQITPPVAEPGQGYPNPVSIVARLNVGFPLARLESPYHNIVSRQAGPHEYRVELAEGAVPADRDFELVWTPQAGREPQGALFTQTLGEETYGLLMLLPPELQWARQSALAKEVIYVVDTSGSMQGTSIQQARKALLAGLDRLQPHDSFNIVQFNSRTSQFAPGAVAADAAELARARDYVRSLRAGGGTEMALALQAVLNGEEAIPRLRQVIFLTDGSVGNEDELFQLIQARLGDSRLYTVGIGSAPNSHFMAEAARAGRGTYTYIGDINEVGAKIEGLLKKLEFPVLSDLALEWSSGRQADYWPNPLRDLYVHEPLVVSFRLNGADEHLRLKGTMHGRDWTTELPVRGGAAGLGLDVLWARHQIQSLNHQRGQGVDPEAIKEAITRLGLKHHIVTAHTSLVAEDVSPGRPRQAQSKDHAVPNLKPRGWTMRAPGGRLPQTATPAAQRLILGGVLGLLCLLIVLRYRTRRWA